jgi:hypothetical protein
MCLVLMALSVLLAVSQHILGVYLILPRTFGAAMAAEELVKLYRSGQREITEEDLFANELIRYTGWEDIGEEFASIEKILELLGGLAVFQFGFLLAGYIMLVFLFGSMVSGIWSEFTEWLAGIWPF